MGGKGQGDPGAARRALPGLHREAQEPGGLTSLRRLIAYCQRRYGLLDRLERIPDGRAWAKIPLLAVLKSVFLLFVLRKRSLNHLEQWLRRVGSRVVGPRVPSADTIGYALSRLDPEKAREILGEIVRQARRRKALGDGSLVLAVDGHEFYRSQSRCCDECTRRWVKKGKERVVEYYHRGVVCEFVGVNPPLFLDFELNEKKEGELTAARRLIKRVVRKYGRLISFMTLDALYCNFKLLKWLAKRGIQVVVVLKDNQKTVNEELDFHSTWFPPARVARTSERVTQYWEVEWKKAGRFPFPVRLVRARRVYRRPLRPPGTVNRHDWEEERVQDWRYVVVGNLSAERADKLGHLRWEEENCGFHELATHWAMNHCFKHDFTAMRNILAMLFIAYGLTRLFFERNVKDPVLRRESHLAQVDVLVESLPRPGERCLWNTS